MNNHLLSILELAGELPQQHNLCSTATDAERCAFITRFNDWWNQVACPAIASHKLSHAARSPDKLPYEVSEWAKEFPGRSLEIHVAENGNVRLWRNTQSIFKRDESRDA